MSKRLKVGPQQQQLLLTSNATPVEASGARASTTSLAPDLLAQLLSARDMAWAAGTLAVLDELIAARREMGAPDEKRAAPRQEEASSGSSEEEGTAPPQPARAPKSSGRLLARRELSCR